MAERDSTRDMHMAILLEELESDPKTRGKLHEIVAEKYPERLDAFPDLAARKTIEPEIAELRKERQQLAEERRTEQQRRNREALHAEFHRLGVKKDAYGEVEAFMVKHNTADPDLAVMGWRREHEVAAPTPRSGAGWGVTLPSDKRAGSFFQGRDGGPGIGEDWREWRKQEVASMLDDYKNGRDPDQVRPMLA